MRFILDIIVRNVCWRSEASQEQESFYIPSAELQLEPFEHSVVLRYAIKAFKLVAARFHDRRLHEVCFNFSEDSYGIHCNALEHEGVLQPC